MSALSLSSLDSDPLLKELSEKRMNFKRNVVSLAAELKDVRQRLALQEEAVAQERHTRKLVEEKARSMEEEITQLQICLQEKDDNLQAFMSARQQYPKELDDLRSRLSITQASADASLESAQSAQIQCFNLSRALDDHNASLSGHELRIADLTERLDILQKDLHARELSQNLLKGEVIRIEKGIKHEVEIARTSQEHEFRKILAEVLPKQSESIINNFLISKDDEMAKLRDDVSQFDKHRTDQEMRKRVLRLDYCLQEARAQIRKLQMMGEKRDNAIKEIKDQLDNKKQNFWQSSNFKIVASMSMFLVVVLAKRCKGRKTRSPIEQTARHKRSGWLQQILDPLFSLSQINMLKPLIFRIVNESINS